MRYCLKVGLSCFLCWVFFLPGALTSSFEYLSTTVIEGLLTSDSKKFVLQVKLMCSYCRKHKETEVPDPYYGGPQGFEKVKP